MAVYSPNWILCSSQIMLPLNQIAAGIKDRDALTNKNRGWQEGLISLQTCAESRKRDQIRISSER
jgi:hypothetical protein